jgi:hypothetical protein
MRKRIVIGVLAIVVIAVGAYFASQPKKGSWDYHKRACDRANERMHRIDWRSRLAFWVRQKSGGWVTPRFLLPDKKEEERLASEIVRHVEVMVQMGALRVEDVK